MSSVIRSALLRAIGLLSDEQKRALCVFLESIDTSRCPACKCPTVEYQITTSCRTCGSSNWSDSDG